MKGLRKVLTPFAPDQSGASGVLSSMGALIVIIDAGGCTGNVCGFDEPRWHESRSAVFSAGLRDMDAILGRDELLASKIKSAVERIDTNFVAVIGTPVPATIGTDYKALDKAINNLKATVSSLKELKKGTDGITGMSSNKALKTAIGTQDKSVQKQLKDSGITSYKALTGAIDSLKQLSGITKTLTSQKGNSPQTTYRNIINTLTKAGYGSMVKALPATYSGLAGKLKQYEDGVRTYRQGLADYAAAPGKLEDGRRQLAEGEAALEDGYKQYNEGKQALADGKAQLAQYEDGEQQVRDGLATLVGTEPDLDLTSILDRLNGDGDFDNGDTHLELDEGLAAVNIGREYQSDDGDLITKEILGRGIGTAALLGAGVLAVLAAILSLLKKNKGAGVLAILSAAAGAAGAFITSNADTYFSSIAGSTVGATGVAAAGTPLSFPGHPSHGVAEPAD